MTTLINWREWSEEAFADAARDDKLVLLDISAVWCHWCHVMDETSYSDPAVAEVINGGFMPVRVDTDRMPDVNERYNMGGWPTTAVLTPTGEVLLGATYVPPEKLKETLEEMDVFYRSNKAVLAARISELREKKLLDMKAGAAAPPGEISPNIAAYVLEELDRSYDPVHGGFGTEPKFPAPEAMELLLTAYRDTGRHGYIEIVEKTLAGMDSYGMYDHVEGGFFRYSVTRDWAVPHYEKMLESNAPLAANYTDAYRVTGDRRYLATAQKTLDYISARLWSPKGFFFGSQDADEEYYKLTVEERLKLAEPRVDMTMFTSLNARAAVAALKACEAGIDAAWCERGLQALSFIRDRMKGEGGGLYHFHDDEPRRYGLLTDNSAAFRAFLYAFQHTGERTWLSEALSILAYIEETFLDAENGGFFDLPDNPAAVAALSMRAKPLAENTEMSVSLKTLSVITGERRYMDMAQGCLRAHSRAYREFGFMAAGYALAVDFLINPATEITIVGEKGSEGMDSLVRASFEAFVPRRVTRLLDFYSDAGEIREKGFHGSGRAAAYICRESACLARIEEPEKLREQLRK